MISRPAFLFSSVCACFVCVHATAQPNTPVQPTSSSPLRTLIVSGGPDAEYTQYAIESNGRYVEHLTMHGQQRVLFADGKRGSRPISTLEAPPDAREREVLAWLLEESVQADATVMKATTLKRLDGSSTPKNILREVAAFTKATKPGERGLIYVTGHGAEGRIGGFFGVGGKPDYENTNYNAWGSDLSMRQLAPALQNWPVDVPLTLVMVQCHDGGFANLMWKDGIRKNGIWPRDFCGFFATTGERLAAGCTSQVDERDYQDFTTHFFAALSGTSRDGRRITGADYDANGMVSGLEALAYADLNDDSIDVPLCTSDAYLRQAFNEPSEGSAKPWLKTPFSTAYYSAAPWQQVVLRGLAREFKMTGEARFSAAFEAQKKLNAQLKAAETKDVDYDYYGLTTMDEPTVWREYDVMRRALIRRFPALKSKKSRSYEAAKIKALAYLKTQPAGVGVLYKAVQAYDNSRDVAETREAKLWRFLRMAHTVVLQKRMSEHGTPEQKAIFARLRASESRNVLQ